MHPIRRDIHFAPPADRVGDWHGQGRHVTHFFNALSIFFPEGERFFIRSVRHYRDRITDPDLANDVAGFIGQEAMHGREHTEYNQLMADAGLPSGRLEQRVIRLLKRVERHTRPAYRLSATIATEHLTAIMADQLLSDPRVLAGSEEHYKRLWRWHAMEETEHKAVAFDVYQQVMGTGLKAYALRAFGLLITSMIFWPRVFLFHLSMLRADKQARGWRGWWSLIDFLFGRVGAFRKLALPWLAYFKPGFHPWDHDNRHFLSQLKELEKSTAASTDVEAAA